MIRYPAAMEPTFSLATLADVDVLHTLVNSAYRGDSSRQGWTTEADLLGGQRIDPEGLRELILQSEQKRILCMRPPGASSGGEIWACVCLERFEDNYGVGCYLGMLTVNPNMQTGGLGKALMKKSEQVAREWGASRMTLGVINVRHELMAWYERRGYAKNGIKEPFPYGDERFGKPNRNDLYFEMFEKAL